MTQRYIPKDYDIFIGIDVDKKNYAFTVKDHYQSYFLCRKFFAAYFHAANLTYAYPQCSVKNVGHDKFKKGEYIK